MIGVYANLSPEAIFMQWLAKKLYMIMLCCKSVTYFVLLLPSLIESTVRVESNMSNSVAISSRLTLAAPTFMYSPTSRAGDN